MTQANAFKTPYKPFQQPSKVHETAQQTPEQLLQDMQAKVDYKSKTFKLMKQMTQLQVINKKNSTQIRHLQNQLQAFKNEFDKIFKSLSVRNLQQAYRRIDDVLRSDHKTSNEIKLSQWSNIVEQYKKIINTQQYKFIKLEQQLKIAEVKIKKYEQNLTIPRQPKQPKQSKEKKQQQKQRQQKAAQTMKIQQDEIAKLKNQLVAKQNEVSSLGEELVVLKKEYKQLLIERQNIKEMYEELQNKYNMQIHHFQEMEKHVEERLIQVERQMNFYHFEREGHLEKIGLMKKQMEFNQQKEFFSFGGVRHESAQTDFQEESSPFNSQCMEISIKTLLQQNEKLKSNLLILYTKKQNDELPKEIELQLKILLNMHDSNLKYKMIDLHEQEQRTEANSKSNLMVSQSIQQLVEQQDCEEDKEVHKEEMSQQPRQ